MKKFLFVMLFVVNGLTAQQMGGLMVMPHHIHFNSNFNRSKIVYVENNSNNSVTIDSIVYNHNVYSIRLNSVSSLPIVMQPHFEFNFEVIQYNYFNLSPEDSASTIKIYNTSSVPLITLEIHQHQNMMNNYNNGNISGTVADSSNAISNAKVYFFYNQIMLIDSAVTDNDGNFFKELPGGDYFVAVKKEGYYTKYAFDNDSPIGADIIHIAKNFPVVLNFILEKELETNLNISGIVSDVGGEALSKAVVVVRKGKHTPTKTSAAVLDDANRSYTTFTDANGYYTLKNIKYAGDYFVQAFAPLNIPGYYDENGLPSVFWQDADSVALVNTMGNIDLTLERDSSYGAGFVAGSVLSNNNQNSPVTDAIVYVRSVSSNKIYTYDFVSSEGNYAVPVLPYGDYELIAQKIGVADAQSSLFTISTTQDSLSDFDITMVITSVKNGNITLKFELSQNYPNPFNPTTTIKYSIPAVGNEYIRPTNKVTLKIYDLLGRKVATLVNKEQTPGEYEVTFDAGRLASGTYIYRLAADSFVAAKKLLLLK